MGALSHVAVSILFSFTVLCPRVQSRDVPSSQHSSANQAGSPGEMVGLWTGHVTMRKSGKPDGQDGNMYGLVSPNGHQMWLTKDKDSHLSTTDNTMLTWQLRSRNETTVVYEARYLQKITGPDSKATEEAVCEIEIVHEDRWNFFGSFGNDCKEEADFSGYRILMRNLIHEEPQAALFT